MWPLYVVGSTTQNTIPAYKPSGDRSVINLGKGTIRAALGAAGQSLHPKLTFEAYIQSFSPGLSV
jgi:hypothetical protein